MLLTPPREKTATCTSRKKEKSIERSRIWSFVSAAPVSLKLRSFAGHVILGEVEGGRRRKRERDEKKKKETTLEHSENEEKPRRQMAETISPIRRSYFSCHARVCEDAVSITEHRHEAELLPLF